ncbi:MAG TPA: tetratricopeptide repeat protein [Candidatus Peribacteraceae bacterium]|nr:tetratricopeptide repeat protein [Candidatus Peribacteraceae bacterium]
MQKRSLPVILLCLLLGACTASSGTADVGDATGSSASSVAVPQDPASAIDLYTNRAFQNDPAAQAELGMIYEKGLGVAKDPVTAYAWFLLAADQKDDDGTIGVQRLSHVLMPQQIGAATTLHDQFKASIR